MSSSTAVLAPTVFIQEAPTVLPATEADAILVSVLRHRGASDADVARVRELAAAAVAPEQIRLLHDAERNPPRLEQYDTFGRRVDKLETSEGWRGMGRFAASQGIMAAAHEGGPRGGGARGRLLQAGMLVCWSSMSAMVGCPLAMTDGAAVVLRDVDPAVARRLWGRDPDRFFTAGQWMTERPGGSDVSNGETWAEPAGDGSNGEWLLTGFKWFSSATDADVALALARTAGTGGRQSLFLVDVARAKREGTVRVERLKRKHGTTPLPTAELRLERAVGRLVGEEGRGVKGISPVLNVTRLHTALHAVSCLTRAAQVVMAYSRVRRVRGRLLLELPLHRHAVAGIQLARLGLTHLALLVAELQGKTEAGTATAAEGHLGRALTPLTKAYVSTRGYAATRDCCEALGGLGCIETEDAGLNVSRVLRDALVATIWEGTSNVLAMDFWRVVNGGGGSSGGPVRAAFKEVLGIEIGAPGHEALQTEVMFDVGDRVCARLLEIYEPRFATAYATGKRSVEIDDALVDFVPSAPRGGDGARTAAAAVPVAASGASRL